MSGFGVDTDQIWFITALVVLQGSGKFERVRRYYTVIVICSSDHSCRVAGAFFDIVQRRVFDQVVELILVIAAAVLYGPAPAYSEFMIAQHIQYTYLRDGDCIQIGALRQAGTDQQATIRTTADSELAAGSIFLFDQEFCTGDKVVKYILFVRQHTTFVPFFTKLATTTQIGQAVYATAFQEWNQCHRK
ncbi:hypothetical protein D3C86_1368000 [compost metagenome]